MAPPVNQSGHPPGVTALIVTKETDVTHALTGSREMVVLNAHRITMGMIVVMILLFVIFGQCNAGNSEKKYGGTREDASVTVQGNKSKFNHSSS